MNSYKDNMSIKQGIRSRQACIKDTRITVTDILSYLGSSMANAQILDDFPELSNDDILAALAYAA